MKHRDHNKEGRDRARRMLSGSGYFQGGHLKRGGSTKATKMAGLKAVKPKATPKMVRGGIAAGIKPKHRLDRIGRSPKVRLNVNIIHAKPPGMSAPIGAEQPIGMPPSSMMRPNMPPGSMKMPPVSGAPGMNGPMKKGGKISRKAHGGGVRKKDIGGGLGRTGPIGGNMGGGPQNGAAMRMPSQFPNVRNNMMPAAAGGMPTPGIGGGAAFAGSNFASPGATQAANTGQALQAIMAQHPEWSQYLNGMGGGVPNMGSMGMGNFPAAMMGASPVNNPFFSGMPQPHIGAMPSIPSMGGAQTSPTPMPPTAAPPVSASPMPVTVPVPAATPNTQFPLNPGPLSFGGGRGLTSDTMPMKRGGRVAKKSGGSVKNTKANDKGPFVEDGGPDDESIGAPVKIKKMAGGRVKLTAGSAGGLGRLQKSKAAKLDTKKMQKSA